MHSDVFFRDRRVGVHHDMLLPVAGNIEEQAGRAVEVVLCSLLRPRFLAVAGCTWRLLLAHRHADYNKLIRGLQSDFPLGGTWGGRWFFKAGGQDIRRLSCLLVGLLLVIDRVSWLYRRRSLPGQW